MNFGAFQPVMAWTLLVIIIPVVIHLLSRSKGKILKVAYTHLISSPKQKPVADIRLEQPWLLLLRLLLLILISLLLMQLWWQDSPTSVDEQQLITVSPNWLNLASIEQREKLAQEVQTSSHPSFLLAVPASRINAQKIRQWQASTTSPTINNVWAHIAVISSNQPSSLPLTIYAVGSEADFWGNKNRLDQNIDWNLLESPQGLNTNTPIKIVLHADNDTPYLRHWQFALSALKQGPLPALSVETIPTNVKIDKTQAIDWIVRLSATPAQEFNDFEQVAALNNATDNPNFPLLLGEAIVKKHQHRMSYYPALTNEQIAFTGSKTLIPSSNATAQGITPENNNNTMLILVVLLTMVFCAERVCSEHGRKKRVSQRETL